MANLPGEMWLNIFQYLPFRDLVMTSTVSKTFNYFAGQIFKTIDQVQLQVKPTHNGHFLPEHSFILFEKENSLILQVSQFTDHSNLLLNFLAAKCPNLSVINAPEVVISLEILIKMSKRIKYFSCDRICASDELLYQFLRPDNFPNLMAFDTGNLYTVLNFRKELIKANGKFFQLFQSINDDDTLPLTMKSLKLSSRPFTIVHMPRSLAQSLEVLQLLCVQPNLDVNFPNLKLFKIICDGDIQPVVSLISDTNDLRVLDIDCASVSVQESLDQLSQLLLRWKNIRFLSLRVTSVQVDGLQLQIPSLAKLLHLSLSLNASIVFTSLPKVDHMSIQANTFFTPGQMDLGNLITFRLTGRADVRGLLMFLCKCSSLLNVSLSVSKDSVSLTNSNDLLVTDDRFPYSCLEFLYLRCERRSSKNELLLKMLFFGPREFALMSCLPEKMFKFNCSWYCDCRGVAVSLRQLDESQLVPVSEILANVVESFGNN